MIYLTIRKPKDIKSKAMEQELKDLLASGVKTNEILLRMEFVTTDEAQKELENMFYSFSKCAE